VHGSIDYVLFLLNIQDLNKSLNACVLPDCLNFSIKPSDIEKLKYNAFYRSYDFYESKFPKGYECIPGFDKVIQLCKDKANEEEKTPLKEIEERIKEKEIDK
jgi:hypothetical protein